MHVAMSSWDASIGLYIYFLEYSSSKKKKKKFHIRMQIAARINSEKH